MERIASGYGLAEAPVALPDGGVAFADVLGGGVHRWDPASDEVSVVAPGRRGIGGMALHVDGGLVVSGAEVVHLAGAEARVVFTDEASMGVNDLTVDADGLLVVGVMRFRPFRGDAPVPGEFRRVAADGSSTVLVGGVVWPNGCAISADGATFYGCDFARGVVVAAELGADGLPGPARTVVSSPSGEVDGMALDEEGGLWVALGSGGAVGRFRPDGTLDTTIEVPAGFVSSVCFGGTDGRDLFVTTMDSTDLPGARGSVFRARAPVAGLPVPLARC